jgi:solute carrier family 25 (adenine nucleotide translocator) protein 4/5/6/31
MSEVKKTPTRKLTFMENFALSGVAAVISKTVAAPLERIKLLLQNQKAMLAKGTLEKPYHGIMDCITKTLQKEGPLAFWRSNAANCVRYFPTQALNFAFKDKVKQAFSPKKTDSKANVFLKNVLSGGIAGSLSLVFVYSLDYCRTRLANDVKSHKNAGQRQYSGMIDVYRQTIATDGLVGLYRGFMISCIGIFIYRGFYFGLYDTFKPLLGEDAGFLISFALGYAVTVTAGLLSYPIDTVRRLMMMTSGEAVKYTSSLDCFVKVYKSEGPAYFMKGAGTNILRGIAGAGVLSGFDKLVQFYTGGGAKIEVSGG